MSFDIQYDENGPMRVNTDDGFAQVSRSFDNSQDGWMLQQLDPADFPAIRTGRDMEWLVSQVNKLRRENFELKQELELWKSVGLKHI